MLCMVFEGNSMFIKGTQADNWLLHMPALKDIQDRTAAKTALKLHQP